MKEKWKLNKKYKELKMIKVLQVNHYERRMKVKSQISRTSINWQGSSKWRKEYVQYDIINDTRL